MNMKKLNILVIPAWFDHEKNSSGIFIHEFCELLNQDKRIGISVLYLHFFSFRKLFPFWFKKPPINDTNYNVIYVKIFNLKKKPAASVPCLMDSFFITKLLLHTIEF